MSELPVDLKCPFRATLITRSFSCPYASEITRREGPDISCSSSQTNSLCHNFYNQLRTRALTAMGHEDDLTTLPASVLQKIQYGGLLGLYNTIHGLSADVSNADNMDNIAELLETCQRQFGELEKFPYAQCIEAIEAYKIKRRRDR